MKTILYRLAAVVVTIYVACSASGDQPGDLFVRDSYNPIEVAEVLEYHADMRHDFGTNLPSQWLGRSPGGEKVGLTYLFPKGHKGIKYNYQDMTFVIWLDYFPYESLTNDPTWHLVDTNRQASLK